MIVLCDHLFEIAEPLRTYLVYGAVIEVYLKALKKTNFEFFDF